jgi:hypothetical protein
MNYLRAEGNRAFLQDRPMVAGGNVQPLSYGLPETLPVSGCTVVPQDTYLSTYMLTNPLSSLRNREKMAFLANLPIGASPELQPNILPVCKTGLSTCGVLPCQSGITTASVANPGAFLL